MAYFLRRTLPKKNKLFGEILSVTYFVKYVLKQNYTAEMLTIMHF